MTDDQGAEDQDEVTITVNTPDVNQAPVANAGEDLIINLPTNSTTIKGSGSDPGPGSDRRWAGRTGRQHEGQGAGRGGG